VAIKPQLTWLDRVQQTLAIERESDAFSRTRDDDPESTYWTREDVERLQAEIDQHLLRIVPDDYVEQMGGVDGPPRLGLVRRDFASGETIEQGVVRIIASRMQTAADKPFRAARGPVTIAEWTQLSPATPLYQRHFVLLDGHVFHPGYRLRLLYVIEPTLEDFQTDAVFIPPAGYAEMARDWVHHQLIAADWFPIART